MHEKSNFRKEYTFHPDGKEVMQNAKGNTYNNRKISTKNRYRFLKEIIEFNAIPNLKDPW